MEELGEPVHLEWISPPDAMPPDQRIIADTSADTRARRVFIATLALSLVIGSTAAWVYAGRGLTLSYFDARPHLVVARRIFDSLTPGWRQIGGLWLPLPHLLNALPVQWDWAYRTGATAVALSIGALAIGLAAFARWLWRETGSALAAVVAPLLILLNPGVLFLQSTPLTEALLFGLSLVAITAATAFLRGESRSPRRLAMLCAALVSTRYEGWCIAGALIALVGVARSWRTAASLLAYPAVAIAFFVLISWGADGHWFTMSGFFDPDPTTWHAPFAVLRVLIDDSWTTTGAVVAYAASIGAAICLSRAMQDPGAATPIALVAAAALAAFAYYQGHPARARFVVALAVAGGALAATALVAVPRRWRGTAALGLVALMILAQPPIDLKTDLITEAAWDLPYAAERRALTTYLAQEYDGRPILASMNALSHVMQESATAGIPIRAFIHEGNGDLWTAAVDRPQSYVGWILIDERPGRDALAARAHAVPAFLAGYSPVASGNGIVLYGRDPVVVSGPILASGQTARAR